MASVCLNMIVRNESRVIRRCLDSLAAQIDHWVIVDTGSSDETPALIRDYFERKKIPGELHHRKWVDFGHNRTEALELAWDTADYLLLCDADMVLEVIRPDWKRRLNADAYLVTQRDAVSSYRNIRLLNARLSGKHRFRYWGATHEYLAPLSGGGDEYPVNDDIRFLDLADGGARTDKHERDLRLLEAQLERLESANPKAEERRRLFPRTLFYLANTHYYLKHLEQALALYRRRAAMEEGFDEERYCALLQAGRCLQRLGRPWADIEAPLLEAWRLDKRRAESLLPVVWHYQDQEDFETAYGFSALVAASPPPDALFVETAAYSYFMPAAHVLNCAQTGRLDEAADTCRRMLEDPELTSRQQQWARQKLKAIEAARAGQRALPNSQRDSG